MSEKSEEKFGGLTLEDWAAAYRPEIHEFFVSRFAFVKEGNLVRIALGRNGAPKDAQGLRGPAVYTHAITMTQEIALELSRQLRDVIAG